MAIFTQKLRNQFNAANHREFIMDGANEAEDLAALPGIEGCAIGSIARHLKSKKSYILDSTGKWVEYPFSDGGGSGGGGGGDDEGSDWSDIDGTTDPDSDYDWEDL